MAGLQCEELFVGGGVEGDAAGWAAVTCAGYRYRAQDTDPAIQSPSRVWCTVCVARLPVAPLPAQGQCTRCCLLVLAWCGNIITAAQLPSHHQQVDTHEAFLSLCSEPGALMITRSHAECYDTELDTCLHTRHLNHFTCNQQQ